MTLAHEKTSMTLKMPLFRRGPIQGAWPLADTGGGTSEAERALRPQKLRN